MKVYEGTDIRNVALVGHGHSGKTSLAAGILFSAGATNRLTRVDEGNTITDFDDDEIARKITISTAVACVEWKKKKLNLLDTPGFNIFINDTKASMVAAEAALVVVDGVAGVEVQTEKTWQFAEEFKLPRALVINKLDRERSSFERTLESIQSVFGRSAVPIHLPLGAEREFKGIVDLIRMKVYTYTPDGDGKGKEGEIPAGLADAATKAHEALVEMVAEGNDALLEEFNIARLRKTPAIALSGGERRRVEIARSLATRPNYMLLDEPFAGIDPIAVGDIQDLVRHLTNRGIGVLITDHNVRETLGLTDRAYIVYAGEILTEGSPDEIVNNPDVRRLYLGEEFRL